MKVFFVYMLTLTILFSNTILAISETFNNKRQNHVAEWTNVELQDRTYIDRELSYESDDGDHLIWNQWAIPYNSLYEDEKGLYFKSFEVGWLNWECEFCHYLNGNAHTTCQNKECRKRRPGYS